MTVQRIVPVILSGGAGTRLWPLSRELFPKQFHDLTGEGRSLFQDTVARVQSSHRGFADPIVVTNEAHRFALGAQIQEIGVSAARILLEPSARGTAAAIAAAALLDSVGDDDLLLALPTDHFFGDPDAFRAAVRDAAATVANDRIVTFGLRPERPETGYGYIYAGDPVAKSERARNILGFIEKPKSVDAERFRKSGEHFWNLGIFLFRKRTMLREMTRFAPDIVSAARAAVQNARSETDFLRLDAEAFAKSPKISIDYAVMEKTRAGAVYPVDFAWSDLGSWSSLWDARRAAGTDPNETVVSGEVRAIDVTRSYIRSDQGLVVAMGVSDLIVVASGDATLVAAMDRAGDVGEVVERLRREGRREAMNHTRVFRPWGHFLTLAEGPGYQVKTLTLNPFSSISHQFHRHRAERWIIVEGEAQVTVDGEIRTLKQHESIEISIGAKHRLSNPASTVMKVIEIQSGSYLGEDDIVRLDGIDDVAKG